jgi:hypothetical protein
VVSYQKNASGGVIITTIEISFLFHSIMLTE